MKKVKNKILNLSIIDNAIDYLEMAALYIQKTETKLSSWKWVLLSINSSLCTFAVYVLDDVKPYKDNFKTNMKIIDTIKKAFKNHDIQDISDNLHNIYLKTPDLKALDYLKIIYSECFNFSQINQWNLEVHVLPFIIIEIIDIIEFFVNSNKISNNISDTKRRKLKTLLLRCRNLIKRSILYNEYLNNQTVYNNIFEEKRPEVINYNNLSS